jgi:hypothetical protein
MRTTDRAILQTAHRVVARFSLAATAVNGCNWPIPLILTLPQFGERGYPTPSLRNALLIQESLFSCGSKPLPFTS